MVAPVLEGAARRWFFKHITIATALGVLGGEIWWRGYALPRREARDKYFADLGVEWTRIVD